MRRVPIREVSCIGPVRCESCDVFVAGAEDESVSLLLDSLRSRGYGVCAGTPAAALRLAARCDIALLITDVVLPQTSGLELAAQLRDMLPDLKVIYVSRETDPVMVRGRIDAGSDFLIVPVNVSVLLQKVSGLLASDWWVRSAARRPGARSSARTR